MHACVFAASKLKLAEGHLGLGAHGSGIERQERDQPCDRHLLEDMALHHNRSPPSTACHHKSQQATDDLASAWEDNCQEYTPGKSFYRSFLHHKETSCQAESF